jgi:superfamily II DNA or RNA helicase
MARKPIRQTPPPAFVNLRGEAIDPFNRGRTAPASAPAEPAQVPELLPADLEQVFDALCLAGCARSKTWIFQFLRTLERRNARGAYFTVAEVNQALNRLREQRRVSDTIGMGLDIDAEKRTAQLPRLLNDPANAEAWKAWARCGSYLNTPSTEPPAPDLRRPQEAVALARLMLYSGMTLDAFRTVSNRMLGYGGANSQALAEALCTPFMPELFDRMQPTLRDSLLESFQRQLVLEGPIWTPLWTWVEAQVRQSRAERVTAGWRFALAERRLHLGDLPAAEQALSGLSGIGLPIIRAAMLAWQGQWSEASAAFTVALKQAAQALKMKRGFAAPSLLQWHVLSLLAQPQAAAWVAAQKFCIAESGMRQPPTDEGWGLWAHAIAARLGDTALESGALAWPKVDYLHRQIDTNANRLLLAAWLGQRPDGWTAEAIDATVHGLERGGQPWKADLLRQACERLGLPQPARAANAAPVWAARFYGARQEAWRDALAAISALAPGKSTSGSRAEPVTLMWRITLDSAGRVSDVEPFERVAGVRGPGKPKLLTLSKVKKMARLDPRDAAVARCIDSWRWNPGRLAIDVVGAAIALIGHPDLVFADAPGRAVDLREALPLLEVHRQRDKEGRECFVFQLGDALSGSGLPDPGERFTSTDAGVEQERRNSLRIFRDGDDRARLIRISPAQRRVAELVSQSWTVPVDAKAELEAALRVLAGHFQLQSDAAAGQAVASDARLRAQLSPAGDGLQLRLLVQPFGSFGPLLAPGSGRPRLMTLHEGLSLSTERNLDAERRHLAQVLEALPFLADADNGQATWLLDDPEAALAAVEQLPRLPDVAALDWPRGKPVRVLTPPTALQVSVGSGADWFAVDGELRIDESRVLGLQRLMQLAAESRRGRFVALGEGEYLALTDRLRQQLADLQALAQAGKEGLRLPAAATAWLAETLDGATVSGDNAWSQRLARLDEAAALQPEAPATLQAQLRQYQADGYAWMARLAHAGLGACLADDMGLGKTVQTLALLLHRADLGPTLVIAPTSVCGNWVAEAARFAPSLRVLNYGEGDRQALLATAGPGDLLVASYSLVQIDAEAFAARQWATLVLDEAQALKNAATKRVKAIATLQADFRLALTGTPVENRLADLWSIMNLLNPGLLGNSQQFNDRFALAIERERDEVVRGRLRRLMAPFLLRRTKAQVLPDLPPRTEIIHRIEPGPEERAFLEAARRSAIERVSELAGEAGEGQAAFHVLAELTRLRRAACDPRLVAPELGLIGAKSQEFEQLAQELVAGRHKALVFSQFTDFLKLLGERLDAAGIRYQYLDGSTPAAERSRRVAAFQRGEGELFLISLKAGGFGLNLTAADYVLIVDPWWNPAAEDQAMGRAHRIGQQRPVTVYRLVTAGSIEERIVELHRDKRTLAEGILEGQDQGRAIQAAELAALLRDEV